MIASVEVEPEIYDDGYLHVEYEHFYITCGGVPIYTLRRKEFLLFACLLRANGRPMPHQEIWQAVWQNEEYNSNTLRVQVVNLRQKLTPFRIDIVPMIGVGYYLRLPPQ